MCGLNNPERQRDGLLQEGLELPVHCCGPISRPVSGRGTLTHAVALRLYNSLIAVRLNCEAMACTSLGRQSEVWSNRDVGVAKQRHVCHQSAITTIRIAVSSMGRREFRASRIMSPRWGLEDHPHTPFHGLTPMATSYRRSAAKSQNPRLAKR